MNRLIFLIIVFCSGLSFAESYKIPVGKNNEQVNLSFDGASFIGIRDIEIGNENIYILTEKSVKVFKKNGGFVSEVKLDSVRFCGLALYRADTLAMVVNQKGLFQVRIYRICSTDSVLLIGAYPYEYRFFDSTRPLFIDGNKLIIPVMYPKPMDRGILEYDLSKKEYGRSIKWHDYIKENFVMVQDLEFKYIDGRCENTLVYSKMNLDGNLEIFCLDVNENKKSNILIQQKKYGQALGVPNKINCSKNCYCYWGIVKESLIISELPLK